MVRYPSLYPYHDHIPPWCFTFWCITSISIILFMLQTNVSFSVVQQKNTPYPDSPPPDSISAQLRRFFRLVLGKNLRGVLLAAAHHLCTKLLVAALFLCQKRLKLLEHGAGIKISPKKQASKKDVEG